ncbi:hypothetical protein D3C87_1586830 [compost metagenome]
MKSFLTFGIFLIISVKSFAADNPVKNKVTDRFWCQDVQCEKRQKAREKDRSRTERSQQKKMKKTEPLKAPQEA